MQQLKRPRFELQEILFIIGLAVLLLILLPLFVNGYQRNALNLAGTRLIACMSLPTNRDKCKVEADIVLERSHFASLEESIVPRLAQVVLGMEVAPFKQTSSSADDRRIRVSSFLSLADLFAKRGDDAGQERAILAYLRLEEQPMAVAYYKLGELYFRQKKYPETIRAFQTALQIDQNTHEFANWRLGVIYFYSAEAYRYQGQFEQALRNYPLVIQYFPEKGWPVYAAALNAADIYLQQENISQALSFYLQAEGLAIEPEEQANVCLRFADYYKHIGDNKQASIQLEKAAALQPDNQNLLVTAARIFEEIGNIPGAIQAYQRLLQIDPNMTYAQQNLERLSK